MKFLHPLFAASLIVISGFVANNYAYASEGIITLDLTKPLNPESFEFESDGTWSDIYTGVDGLQDYFEAQIFMMGHIVNYGGTSWDGLVPCKSTDMKDSGSYTTGCMAGGGIATDENGDIILDEQGNVEIDVNAPYLVAYYSSYAFDYQSCPIIFNDGLEHEVVGIYVTNFPTSFYNCVYGNAYARPFVNGDKFTLTIHGVAADMSEKTVDVDLIAYNDGMLQAIRGWKYIDLSSLGKVQSLYFTINSTDVGAYGVNTTTMVCLDKLMVKENTAGIAENNMSANSITYDRATAEVVLPQSDFAIVYNAAGQKVMTASAQRFSVSNLEKGLYIVKTATGSLRFVK